MLLWLACASPPLLEVSIVGGNAQHRQVVEEALADFKAWSGRQHLPLGTITLQAQVEQKEILVEGLYLPSSHQILLAEDHPDLRENTLHELCHALDNAENLSDKNAHIFEEGRLLPSAVYDNARLRRHEVFARVCEQGALDLGLLTQLEQQCGKGFIQEDVAFVQKNVYPHGPHLQMQLGGQPVWDAQPLSGPIKALLSDAVGDSEHLWLLLEQNASLFSAENPEDRPGWGDALGEALILLQWDPDTGQATSFPLPDLHYGGEARLVAGLPPRLWVRDVAGEIRSFLLGDVIEEEDLSLPAWPQLPSAVYSVDQLFVLDPSGPWSESLSTHQRQPLTPVPQQLSLAGDHVEFLRHGMLSRPGGESPLPEGPLAAVPIGKQRLLLVPGASSLALARFDPAREQWWVPRQCPSLPAWILSLGDRVFGVDQDRVSAEILLGELTWSH